jgi:hypothetical protein
MRRLRVTAMVLGLGLAVGITPTAWAKCDPTGAGDAPATQSNKVALNTLKNRTELPSGTRPITVQEILNFADREDQSLEATGVVLEGWLLGRRHEGPESPNCHSQTRRDFHMWVGDAPQQPKNSKEAMGMRDASVVVEPTPNLQELHGSWTDKGLQSLVRKRIRVTGWLMYDPEHPDQVGNTRGTLWEVHPVMQIEVQQPDGSWKSF